MYYLFEIGVVMIFTMIFYRYEKPQLKYLLYGYAFFVLALLLQLPFKYLEVYIQDWFDFALLSQILLAPLIIIISELTKYFSLKRFLFTKTFKNAIFFGIGWVSLESINIFTIVTVSYFLGLFNLAFDINTMLNPSYGAINFLYFFVINIAITIFVIKAVITNQKKFLFHAIIFSLIIYYGLLLLTGIHKNTFTLTSLAFAGLIIFFYKYIK
jgi:hypothetical protein